MNRFGLSITARGFLRWVVLLTMASVVGGCAVRFVSQYDQRIDAGVMQVQRKVESLLVKIEAGVGGERAGQAGYERFRGEYESIKVDIRTIEIRVASQPQNHRTAVQVQLLMDSVRKLEAIHKEGIVDRQVTGVLREQFRSAFVAILTLELAKKRGG